MCGLFKCMLDLVGFFFLFHNNIILVTHFFPDKSFQERLHCLFCLLIPLWPLRYATHGFLSSCSELNLMAAINCNMLKVVSIIMIIIKNWLS